MVSRRQTASITAILARLEAGERDAIGDLLPEVYDELHGLAEGVFRAQRSGHTLQPTALVHEAYLKLARMADSGFRSRQHFFAVAARVMRQILADHARARQTAKRGGDRERVTLEPSVSPLPAHEYDLVALDAGLRKLESLNPRHAQVVELRFLAGLNIEDVAEVLGVSRRTVELDWRTARAWLRRELSDEPMAT